MVNSPERKGATGRPSGPEVPAGGFGTREWLGALAALMGVLAGAGLVMALSWWLMLEH